MKLDKHSSHDIWNGSKVHTHSACQQFEITFWKCNDCITKEPKTDPRERRDKNIYRWNSSFPVTANQTNQFFLVFWLVKIVFAFQALDVMTFPSGTSVSYHLRDYFLQYINKSKLFNSFLCYLLCTVILSGIENITSP